MTISEIDQPTETCHGLISSAPKKTLMITEEQIIEGYKSPIKEDLIKCKPLAKEALTKGS